ncbi:MAG: DegQ family serine endoprotease [Caulobacterales bacterium]|jgi:Do/DeqQ family serine protease
MRSYASACLFAAALIACSAPPSTGGAEPPAGASGPSAPADAGLILAQAGSDDRRLPASRDEMRLSLAPIAAKASPAVVNVYAQRVTRTIVADPSFGPFAQFFGVPRDQIQRSLGSGVLVRADGVIVTNNHVVEGAQQLKVVLSDRREFDAKLITADPRTDLAVLRIDAKGQRLPALAFADTRKAQVGDLVLAIGNPFGLQQTVTSGIISALARTDVGINDFSFFIQTDAAINKGNSGGALVDSNGDLVGVNTAIFSESGGSVGIGFAIPSEMVRRVVESAVTSGTVVRPWLGVRGQPVTSDVARSLGFDRPRGVLVTEVYPGGPAARAGLRAGDVVLTVNDAEVNDEQGVRFQAATQRPGADIKMQIIRGQQRQTLAARAEAPPRTPAPDPRDISGRNPLAGTRVVTLSPGAAEEAGLDPFATGVYVQAMDNGGPAAQLGLRPGDIVREVNGQPVRTTADLERLIKAAGAQWRIVIERGGERAELNIRL